MKLNNRSLRCMFVVFAGAACFPKTVLVLSVLCYSNTVSTDFGTLDTAPFHHRKKLPCMHSSGERGRCTSVSRMQVRIASTHHAIPALPPLPFASRTAATRLHVLMTGVACAVGAVTTQLRWKSSTPYMAQATYRPTYTVARCFHPRTTEAITIMWLTCAV